MSVSFEKGRKRPWKADFQVVEVKHGQKITKRRRRYFRTKSEARACYDEMCRKYLDDLEKPLINVPTLQNAAQEYLDQHFVRKSPNYKHNEAQRLEYWLAVLKPHRLLTDILPVEIDRVLTVFLKANRAHTTVAKYRAAFQGLWKFCMRRRYVNYDLLADVSEIPRRPKRKIQALTEAQCEMLLAQMSLPARRCFLLLLHLGIRAGELFGDSRKGRRPMTVEDVDWERDAVHVFSNEEEGETKGHDDRWAPLDDVTRAIFAEVGHGPVCGDAEYWWFRDQMEKAAQRSGVGHATMHQLRHSFASINLANGVPEAVVQAWLGHKDSSITKRYTHLGEVLNEEYRGKIGIGETALAPVPRFLGIPKKANDSFPLKIATFQKNNVALPTGLEPVF